MTVALLASNVASRRLVARPQLFQNDAPAVVKEKTKEVKEAVQSVAPSLPSVGLPSISLTPSLLALPGASQLAVAQSLMGCLLCCTHHCEAAFHLLLLQRPSALCCTFRCP